MNEAAFQGELGVCQFLCERGATETVRTKNSDGWTPVMAACRGGQMKVLRWLVEEAGCAQDASVVDDLGCSPLSAACEHGHLRVAQWLFGHLMGRREARANQQGSARAWLHPQKDGSTPMLAACRNGHLDVAKWLFQVGGTADIRTGSLNGHTPMLAVCLQGHLDVARWLFASGASDDLRLTNTNGWSPMRAAASLSNLDMALWLLLQGAANSATSGDEDSHVDPSLLMRDVGPWDRKELRVSLAASASEQQAFLSLILGATSLKPSPSSSSSRAVSSLRGCCALPIFRGHEGAVLSIVADFAGVVRGRQLRTAREAISLLAAEEDKEVF
jgi:ankyrin repeat protein